MTGMSDLNPEGTKKCPDCGEEKPRSEFWKNKRMPDGLQFYCKLCAGARRGKSYRKRQAAEGKEARPWRPIVQAPEGMKYCPRCDQVKSIDEFGKNRAEKSGLTAYCLGCHNIVMREQRIKRDGSTRNFHLKRRYGLTEGEVDEMIARQGGKCMICRTAPAEHVDHDHKTGEVRGVLCFNCNGGLGQFKDRRDTMSRAIGYLLGTLPPLPVEEMLNERWNVVLTVIDDDTDVRLSADYAHA